MISLADFQFFDPEGEVKITAGDLPHWQQPGATYFITYRTVDSISQDAWDRIIRSRDDWLHRNGINVKATDWHIRIGALSERKQTEFRRQFSIAFEDELDDLAGECPFTSPAVSKTIADSLHHFDGQRYRLAAFVIMPNHIHVLVCVFPDIEMLAQCYSWKHFQASQINEIRKRTGHVFQRESFDHLVRDGEHFMKFRRYIEANPDKAKLKDSEYLLYLPPIERGPATPLAGC